MIYIDHIEMLSIIQYYGVLYILSAWLFIDKIMGISQIENLRLL